MGFLGVSLGPGCLPGRQLSGGASLCLLDLHPGYQILIGPPAHGPCPSMVIACWLQAAKGQEGRVATESPGTLCHAEVLAQAGYSISCYLLPFVKVEGIDLSHTGMMRDLRTPAAIRNRGQQPKQGHGILPDKRVTNSS